MKSPMFRSEDLVALRNTNFEELKTLFDITQRLILEHAFEILNVSTNEWHLRPWDEIQVFKWATAKVHVYSDSVLCPGKMYDHTEANKTSNSPTHTENLESMENQVSSSGIFSRTYNSGDSS